MDRVIVAIIFIVIMILFSLIYVWPVLSKAKARIQSAGTDDKEKPKGFFETITSEKLGKFFAKIVVVIVVFFGIYEFIHYCNIEGQVRQILIYSLVLGGLLCSFLHGEQRWRKNAMWFTVVIIALIAVGGLNRLERQRKPEDKLHVVQKVYNHFVNPKPVEASIRPAKAWKTVFEETYTDANIDKNGYIYTFTWGNRYKKGDFIEIIGEIPEQKKLYVKEIYYYRGKHCTPDWGKTDNGYRKIPINYPPENGKFVIWIEKGKGIKAKVRVRRL